MKYLYLSVCIVVAIGGIGLWPDNVSAQILCGALFGATMIHGWLILDKERKK